MGSAAPTSALMTEVTTEVRKNADAIRSRPQTWCLLGEGWRAYATLIDSDTVSVSVVLPSSTPGVCGDAFSVKL